MHRFKFAIMNSITALSAIASYHIGYKLGDKIHHYKLDNYNFLF